MTNLPQTMEEGSGSCTKENVYEDIPLSKPSIVDHTPGETMPLIPRIESDGSADSNEPQPTLAPPIPPPTSSPPVTPQAAAVDSTEETGASPEATQKVYCELQHHLNPVIPTPPLDNEPQYDTVNQFQNPQVHVYM